MYNYILNNKDELIKIFKKNKNGKRNTLSTL